MYSAAVFSVAMAIVLATGSANAARLPDLNVSRTQIDESSLSVLRPTESRRPCTDNDYEFPDLTTNTCASCGQICGAWGLKRVDACLKEPNCKDLDGTWKCDIASCDATCDSPTTKDAFDNLLHVGKKKCTCDIDDQRKKLGGLHCVGSPWINCTEDIMNICQNMAQLKTIDIAIGAILGLGLILGGICLAWKYRSKIRSAKGKLCQMLRLQRPGLPIPAEDLEDGQNPHEARQVDSPH